MKTIAKNDHKQVVGKLQDTGLNGKIIPLDRGGRCTPVATRLGLFRMPVPASVPNGTHARLFAENLMLPGEGGGPARFGCCFYLCSPCGGRAVALLASGTSSRPLLPGLGDGHPFANQIETGLQMAIRSLHSALHDLEGAVVAGRKELQRRGAGTGEIVLHGMGRSVAIAAAAMVDEPPHLPEDRPPHSPAKAPHLASKPVIFGNVRVVLPLKAA